MTLLIDTNVVSELRKGDRAHPRVREWYHGVEETDIHLSALVVGELRRGVELVRKRDSAQANALDRWLTRLVSAHADRILPVDRAIAEEWGRLTAQRTASMADALMAATARVHRLILVTRNVNDVAWTGVPWFNPFAG